jgi:hypothetical protein
VIPTDATAARNPTIKISFDLTKIYTPLCGAALESAHFTEIALTGGDSSNPQVIISRSLLDVPRCTRELRLSSGLTQGLFSRQALFTWSLNFMSPAEPNDVKKIALLNALNRFPISADVILDAAIIA